MRNLTLMALTALMIALATHGVKSYGLLVMVLVDFAFVSNKFLEWTFNFLRQVNNQVYVGLGLLALVLLMPIGGVKWAIANMLPILYLFGVLFAGVYVYPDESYTVWKCIEKQ